MRGMSRIKTFWHNYIQLFRAQECPWCGNKCITYWKKIRLQSNIWDLSYYRKRECPICKKKLKLKTPRVSKICLNIILVLMIVTTIMTILGYINASLDYRFWSCFLIAYLLLFCIPLEKIVRDEGSS